MAAETENNPMAVLRSGNRYVIAAARFQGHGSAARMAASLNLSLREWCWFPTPDASDVKVFRLLTSDELSTVPTPPT